MKVTIFHQLKTNRNILRTADPSRMYNKCVSQLIIFLTKRLVFLSYSVSLAFARCFLFNLNRGGLGLSPFIMG